MIRSVDLARRIASTRRFFAEVAQQRQQVVEVRDDPRRRERDERIGAMNRVAAGGNREAIRRRAVVDGVVGTDQDLELAERRRVGHDANHASLDLARCRRNAPIVCTTTLSCSSRTWTGRSAGLS